MSNPYRVKPDPIDVVSFVQMWKDGADMNSSKTKVEEDRFETGCPQIHQRLMLLVDGEWYQIAFRRWDNRTQDWEYC